MAAHGSNLHAHSFQAINKSQTPTKACAVNTIPLSLPSPARMPGSAIRGAAPLALDVGLAASATPEGGPADVVEITVDGARLVEFEFEAELVVASPKLTLTIDDGVTTLLDVLVFVLVVDVDEGLGLGLGLGLDVDEGAAEAACAWAEGMLAPLASFACPVVGLRYQFAGGSPRQSPTVTRSYPSFLAVSISNWANSCTVNGWMSWAREIHCELAGLCCERIVW